jgi:hypothetical protein
MLKMMRLFQRGFVEKYQVAITLSGGSSPRFCHSKEDLFEILLEHLRAKESIWKLQAVRSKF